MNNIPVPDKQIWFWRSIDFPVFIIHLEKCLCLDHFPKMNAADDMPLLLRHSPEECLDWAPMVGDAFA